MFTKSNQYDEVANLNVTQAKATHTAATQSTISQTTAVEGGLSPQSSSRNQFERFIISSELFHFQQFADIKFKFLFSNSLI